jgi:hypothetical protein
MLSQVAGVKSDGDHILAVYRVMAITFWLFPGCSKSGCNQVNLQEIPVKCGRRPAK